MALIEGQPTKCTDNDGELNIINLLKQILNLAPRNGGSEERAITIAYFITFLLAIFAGYVALNNASENILYHSDALAQEDYLRDLLVRGVDVRTWNASHLDFFQDMWIYALIRYSTGSIYLAFLGLSLAKVIFYVASFYTFLSLVSTIPTIQKLWFAMLATSGLLLASIFLINQLGPIMFSVLADFSQLLTMLAHGSTIINAVMAILLVLLWLRNPSKVRLWLSLLFVLSVLSSFSDRLYMVVFVLPALGSVVILSVLGRVQWRAVVLFGSVILLSDVVGQVLYHKLGPIPIVAYSISLIGGWRPVYEYYIAAFRINWYPPLILLSYACLLGVTSHVLFKAWKLRSHQIFSKKIFDPLQTAKLFLLPYAALVMPVSFLAMGLINRAGSYNTGGNLLALSLWPLLLVMSRPGLRIWEKTWFHITIITTLLLYVGILFASSPMPLSKMLTPSYPDLKLVMCLDAHAGELGAGAGIADYWQARKINLFSTKGLRIDQAQGERLEFFQLVSNSSVLAKRKHTFVITDAPTNLQPMREVDVVRNFGQPDAKFVCEGYPVLVYTNGLKMIRGVGIYNAGSNMKRNTWTDLK